MRTRSSAPPGFAPPPRGAALLALLLLALFQALLPARAAAQTCQSETDPSCDTTAPTITLTPAGGTAADSLLAVSIEWSDDQALAPGTLAIRLNGVDVGSSFSHDVFGSWIQSSGTLRLSPGSNVLAVWILDAAGNRADAGATFAYATTPPPPPPPPPPSPIYDVSVVPGSQAATALANGNRTHVFTVRNMGNRAGLFRVDAPVCPDAAVSQCSPTVSTLALGAGGSALVGVNFRAGAAGQTGRVRLRVRQIDPVTTAVDSAQVTLGTAAAAADTLTMEEVGTDPVIERGMCLTVAAGPGGAYECGDLRLAHALPATAAMNRSRAPVLLYNSQHAHPTPSVAARVTLPAGIVATDVVMTVTLAGEASPRVTRTYSLATWPGGAARRLVATFDALAGAGLPTGIHDYTATVVANTAGGPVTLLNRAGKLPVVNRASSPFGAGWWMGGVELLLPRADGSVMWVGGDGSVRLYAPVAGMAHRWAAPPLDRPDTLYRDSGTMEYFRRLPGGAQVRFDAAGRHVSTTSALGHRTLFGYDAGRLATITLPVGSGGGAAHQYVLGYGGGTLLQSVTAPGGRVVTLRRSGDTLVVRDPDSTEVRFRTDATFANRIFRRTDRAGAVVQYSYQWNKVITVRRYGAGTAEDVVLSFSADPWSPELKGVTPSVVFDGPRLNADAEDKYLFLLNRWGGPQRIRDARQISTGGVKDTWILREDPRFPALPTRTVAPNGREVTVSYDERGNGVASTDWSTRAADGRYASTLQAWDATWDAPTLATGAEGQVTETAYHPATGQALWQQVGGDSARRAVFAYHPPNHPTAPGLAVSVTAPLTGPETYEYDPRGNLSAVVDPAGARTEYRRDAIGRDTLVRSPAGDTLYQELRTLYDAAGRVRETRQVGPPVQYTRRYPEYGVHVPSSSPREEVVVRNEYDAEGRTLAVSRWSVPDTAKVGVLTTRWQYDALGRAIREIAPDTVPDSVRVATGFRSPADSTVYDRAGNAVEVHTRRGHVIRMAYDEMNRLVRRVIPAAEYALDSQRVLADTTPNHDASRAVWNFPLRSSDAEGNLTVPNRPDSTAAPRGLAIPADTSVLAYDEMGNLVRAANRDAIVTRTYLANGAVRSETQRIRPYAGRDTTRHVYTLSYTYDLAGRRDTLQHPAALGPYPGLRTTYRYDGVTGALSQVESDGNTYRFWYDLAGRPDSTGFPGAVRERLRYDAAGRLVRQERWRGGALIQRDTFAHDPRGKVRMAGTLTDTIHNAYSGLGSLIRSFTDVGSMANNDPEEAYTVDALGNTVGTSRVWTLHKQDVTSVTPETTRQLYQHGTGRLLLTQHLQGEQAGRVDAVLFDRAGNRELSHTAHFESGYTGLQWNAATPDRAWVVDRSRMYYAADGKLRVVDRRSCAFARDYRENIGTSQAMLRCYEPFYGSRPALEEHRYDALGRRVLTRTDQSWACGLNCVNGVTRTVWDGDQVLYEMRAPALQGGTTGPQPSAAAMESDTVGSLEVPDRTHYGRVGYVHGPGLDRPLAVVRMDFHPLLPLPEIILPHLNWRGSYEAGTFLSTGSGAHGRCHATPPGPPEDWDGVYVPGPTEEEYTKNTDSLQFCVEVSWPAASRWMTHLERPLERGYAGPRNWMGSLIEEGRDVSGQMYRRNRYYDPQTGKFTQEDPIGLAGGLNAYGYADGDPVSYGDPYGLTGCKKGDPICESVGYKILTFFGVSDESASRIMEPAVGGSRMMAGAGSVVYASGGLAGRVATAGATKAGATRGGVFGLSRTADDILMPGGSPIGQAGSKATIRELPGTVTDAQAMFSQLSAGGSPVAGSYPGTLVRLPGGGTVGMRTAMSRSPNSAATIDVNIPNIPIQKIKFNP